MHVAIPQFERQLTHSQVLLPSVSDHQVGILIQQHSVLNMHAYNYSGYSMKHFIIPCWPLFHDPLQ